MLSFIINKKIESVSHLQFYILFFIGSIHAYFPKILKSLILYFNIESYFSWSIIFYVFVLLYEDYSKSEPICPNFIQNFLGVISMFEQNFKPAECFPKLIFVFFFWRSHPSQRSRSQFDKLKKNLSNSDSLYSKNWEYFKHGSNF